MNTEEAKAELAKPELIVRTSETTAQVCGKLG
jgi:hypothetical protein